MNALLYRDNSSGHLLLFARTTTTTTGTTNDGVPTARSGPVSLWKATLCPRIRKRSHYLSKLHGFLRFDTVSKGMGLTKVSHHLLYGMKGFFKERIEHIETLKSTLNSAVFLGWSQSTQITGLPMQGPGDEMRDLVVLNVTTETVHMIHMVLYDVFDYFGYMSVDTYLHICLFDSRLFREMLQKYQPQKIICTLGSLNGTWTWGAHDDFCFGPPNGWRAACSWMHITFGLLCQGP